MGVLDKLFKRNVKLVRYNNGSWGITNSSSNFDGIDNMELALNSSVILPCIDILADYCSKVKFIQNDGTDFIDFIKNPNPYQSQQDFIKQLVWYKTVFGWVFQRPYSANGQDIPNAIYNLNKSNISFNETIKKSMYWKTRDLKEVKNLSFNYQDYDNRTKMSYSEIIPFYDLANGISGDLLTSPSRIDSIVNQAKNLQAATHAENKAINTMGREMVYKEKSNDPMSGALPFANKDKKDMESKFDSSYGLGEGRSRTVFTNKEMGWKSLNVPTDELGLKGIIENNAPMVAQVLRVPNELYKAYKEGDTFTNKEAAEVQLIQNVAQPFMDNLATSYSSFFNRDLEASFEHLPCMKVIENKKVDSVLKLSQAIKNLVSSGLSIEEAKFYLSDNGINTHEND